MRLFRESGSSIFCKRESFTSFTKIYDTLKEKKKAKKHLIGMQTHEWRVPFIFDFPGVVTFSLHQVLNFTKIYFVSTKDLTYFIFW